jgi:hypothetical protein
MLNRVYIRAFRKVVNYLNAILLQLVLYHFKSVNSNVILLEKLPRPII